MIFEGNVDLKQWRESSCRLFGSDSYIARIEEAGKVGKETVGRAREVRYIWISISTYLHAGMQYHVTFLVLGIPLS